MARRKRARRRVRAITRTVAKSVRRARRRIGGGGGMMGGLIPDTSTLMNAGLGGAGYAAAKGAAGKFLPDMSPMVNGVLAALVVHFIGNKFMGKREIGIAAIGALAADLTRDTGILATIGLGDYYADYYSDNVVHLGTPGGGSVGLPLSGAGMHDISRGRHHRFHDGGSYGASYGAN